MVVLSVRVLGGLKDMVTCGVGFLWFLLSGFMVVLKKDAPWDLGDLGRRNQNEDIYMNI